jgi:hypothetical protein
MLGEILADRGNRQNLVLATKSGVAAAKDLIILILLEVAGITAPASSWNPRVGGQFVWP